MLEMKYHSGKASQQLVIYSQCRRDKADSVGALTEFFNPIQDPAFSLSHELLYLLPLNTKDHRKDDMHGFICDRDQPVHS